MELVLNLVWLMLAAGLLLQFVTNRRVARNGMREWLAVLCVIVLLFPVVSMSDDMILSVACAETGRQDMLAHSLPGGNQSVTVEVSSSASTKPYSGMAFGCRFGVFDFSPQLTICQWSPRVEKRPPPSSYLAS